MTDVKEAARAPSPVRLWWGVVVLMALYAFSMLDRQVISLLVDDIRRDLKVTDFEVGLLQGLSFAVFYAIFGLAFGRATDKASRRGVVFVGVGLWSIAAAACGLARNFWQLLGARFGVGAGEGSLSPAAYSLISDSFPPERLAVPLSVFGIGSTIGVALSYGVTGAVMGALPSAGVSVPLFGHLAVWQLTFLLTAAPGGLLCWLAFTLADPGRRARPAGAPPERLFAFVRQRGRFLFGHFFGYALLSLCAYGVMGWEPMLLHRVYGWAMPKAALALMIQNLIIALGGPFVLGPLIDAWFNRGQKDAHLRLFMIFALVELVFVLLAVTASNPFLCIGFFILWGWMSNTTRTGRRRASRSSPPARSAARSPPCSSWSSP